MSILCSSLTQQNRAVDWQDFDLSEGFLVMTCILIYTLSAVVNLWL